MNNLSVKIGDVLLKNPVMPASGTFSSGMEFSDFYDLNLLGAVVTKGVSMSEWEGNTSPRIAETNCGMLNAIGLQNPGIELFCKRDLEFLKKYNMPIIVNVCGKTVQEYVAVVERLSEEPEVSMLEINISCPNVKEGGIAFGQRADFAEMITSTLKKYTDKPIIMKLSPNVTDITEIAKAVEAGGADAVSLINTVTGMSVDVNKRSFMLGNVTGGLSGPAIKPIALRMVYQVRKAVDLPIIGMGGISNANDALEFMMAGANAVAVGTANFHNPMTMKNIIDDLDTYLTDNHINDINEIVDIL